MNASLDYFNKTTELINNLRDNEMNNIDNETYNENTHSNKQNVNINS